MADIDEWMGSWRKRRERAEGEVERIQAALDVVERQLSEIPGRLAKRLDEYDRGVWGSEAMFRTAIRELEAEQQKLESERVRLTRESERARLSIYSPPEIALEGPTPEQRKALLQHAIERIECLSGEPPKVRIRV